MTSDTVIARDAHVQGRIIGQSPGLIRIEGRLVGGIETSGPAEVTKTGEIAGDIRAGDVTVAGTVYGNVIALGKLTLQPTARVLGDFIRTRELKIAQGALFQGKCEIEDSEGPGPAADAAAPAVPRRDAAEASPAAASARVATALGPALRAAPALSGSLSHGRPLPLEAAESEPALAPRSGSDPEESGDAAEPAEASPPPTPRPFPLLPRARERDPRAGGAV